jgi:hypothetical protein
MYASIRSWIGAESGTGTAAPNVLDPDVGDMLLLTF